MGLSIAAHVAVAVALVLAPGSFPRSDRLRPDSEIAIVITESEPSPPDIVEPEIVRPEPEAVVPEPRPEPEIARRPPAHRAPTGAVVAIRETATAITPEATEPERHEAPQEDTPPVETPEERRRRLEVLLDPRSVAASAFSIEGDGPSQPRGLQSSAAHADRGPREREIERSLATSMREQAMAKAYLARTRPQFRLQRDGSYRYDGHAFRATILPDGSIHFDDRPGILTDGFSASGTFDLNDALMRAGGGDPYAAERAWVMEHTEDLRARLEAEHRRASMESALSGIAAECRRIWGRTTRSAAQRRRQIFELWDDAEEEGEGARARAAILRWIRENLPRDGGEGYSAEELARLNASRRSRAEFDPYR
jgi:hypothetical protein